MIYKFLYEKEEYFIFVVCALCNLKLCKNKLFLKIALKRLPNIKIETKKKIYTKNN
jgi:hypothetical protein